MSTRIPESEPQPTPATYSQHVVQLPTIFINGQVLILVSSCAVLGLSAYSLSFGDGDHGNVSTLIIAVVTIIVLPYFLVSSLVEAAAFIYHRIAILVLTILGVIAWAGAFINLALEITGAWNCYRNADFQRVCYWEHDLPEKPYYREMVAEATLGGLIFGLLVLLLFGFSFFLNRARREGQPANYWAARDGIANAQPKPNFAETQERNWNLQNGPTRNDENGTRGGFV